MKIGNTDFNVSACKKLTLAKFKKMFSRQFKGMPIEKAWRILNNKVTDQDIMDKIFANDASIGTSTKDILKDAKDSK